MDDPIDELRQPDGLRIIQADTDEHWQQYDAVATRSYGHPVGDIPLLRHHADLRVAVVRGEIAAGGLSVSGHQYFGGKPVPAALLGAGCVAPEYRGSHLSTRLISERLRPLQEQGAVLATLWTAATGHVQRMGWTAPVQAFSWAVPTDELRRSFTDAGYDVTHGRTQHSDTLHRQIAARWNGPWQRPAWWHTWQQAKHPGLTTYEFRLPHHQVSGSLSVAFEHHSAEQRLVVHDFWADTAQAAAAMLAFLGRHNSRIPTIDFQRTALPPRPPAPPPPAPNRKRHRPVREPVAAPRPRPARSRAAARLARRRRTRPPHRGHQPRRGRHHPLPPPHPRRQRRTRIHQPIWPRHPDPGTVRRLVRGRLPHHGRSTAQRSTRQPRRRTPAHPRHQ
ncbi:GNAT superfamily N-acetyltransferase [Streptomyces ambofaciens]